MINFICDSPVILQDVTKFGFTSWVIPFAILFLALSGTRKVWLDDKKFHAKVIRKNFPGGHELKFPWLGLVLSSLAFLCLSFLILQDRAEKLNALKTGEYITYQGHIAQISRLDKRGRSLTRQRVQFKITGHATDSDGRNYELHWRDFSDTVIHDRVTTQHSIVADWGNSCSWYSKCGLSVGDKVRIKKVPYANDTLSIEKCEIP